MSNQDIIKFTSVKRGDHQKSNRGLSTLGLSNYSLAGPSLSDLIACRQILKDKKFIGTLQSGKWKGYDYGNISTRVDGGMLISASQTSGQTSVGLNDFSFVSDYDASSFTTQWYGQKPPSSETPLHWIAYKNNKECSAVVHVHVLADSPEFLIVDDFFTENKLAMMQQKNTSYQNAVDLDSIIKDKGMVQIIGMKGHEGGFGLIVMDSHLAHACDRLTQFFKKLKNRSEKI